MAKICVLLSTYNGEKFLREQLESLFAQKGVDMQLFVRDDGSKDGTVSILQEYEKAGKLTLVTGKNIGLPQSFSWLICNAPKADFYACCDQDDVWLPDKLKNGVECLEKQDNSISQLYFTSMIVVDQNLKTIVLNNIDSWIDNPKNALAESLVVNKISGCTMVFNEKLRQFYAKIPIDMVEVQDHTLNILAAATGEIHFDKNPQILYRQHGNNSYGYRRTLPSAIKFFFNTEIKSWRYRNAINLKISAYEQMSEENKKFLDMVLNYKYDKAVKKQLKKYIKNNIMFKPAAKFANFLIRHNKF